MTDYDLRTERALRRVVLLEYGFGPETLRGHENRNGNPSRCAQRWPGMSER